MKEDVQKDEMVKTKRREKVLAASSPRRSCNEYEKLSLPLLCNINNNATHIVHGTGGCHSATDQEQLQAKRWLETESDKKTGVGTHTGD